MLDGDVGVEFEELCFLLSAMTAAHRLPATVSRQVEDTAGEATAAVAVVGVRLAATGAAGVTSNHHHHRSTEEVTTTHLRATAPHRRRATASRASTGRVEVSHGSAVRSLPLPEAGVFTEAALFRKRSSAWIGLKNAEPNLFLETLMSQL